MVVETTRVTENYLAGVHTGSTCKLDDRLWELRASGNCCRVLIEINPRCTQLGHLRLANQGDLVGALSSKLWNQPIPAATARQDYLSGETIAFFPQAIQWNPRSPYLRCGKHDVPWEEPALVLELLRGAWPERKWLSRLYHHYRAPSTQEEVNFEPFRDRLSREQRV
jgi:hypothetical protein